MDKTKKTVMGAKEPERTCSDQDCPFHGTLSVHGKTFIGTVIKGKMQKTAVVEWTTYRKVQKYERYEKKRTRIKAHNPSCITAVQGEKVRIAETRPLSKTKHFVIIERIK